MELDEEYDEELRRVNRSKNIYFVAAVVALVALAGLSFYDSYQSNAQAASYNSLVSKYNGLLAKADFLNGSVNQLQNEMEQMLLTYDQKSYVFNPPTANRSVAIWGIKQTILPHRSIEWALLDTFVNHLNISSNATAEFVIVDPANYVNLEEGRAYVPLVEYNGTQFMRDERLSQGCSGYILLILNNSDHPILLIPNVTATYAPTTFLTGYCTLGP